MVGRLRVRRRGEMVAVPPLVLENLRNSDFQPAGECLDRVQRRVRPPSLNPTHVGPGKAAAVRERFLGQTCSAP